jgi:hypothetical protein
MTCDLNDGSIPVVAQDLRTLVGQETSSTILRSAGMAKNVEQCVDLTIKRDGDRVFSVLESTGACQAANLITYILRAPDLPAPPCSFPMLGGSRPIRRCQPYSTHVVRIRAWRYDFCKEAHSLR